MKKICSLFLALCLLAVLPALAQGILPQLAGQLTAISLHSVTAKEPDKSFELRGSPGSVCFSYNGVDSFLYEQFSIALGKEGYALDAHETTPDGVSKLTVTKGEISLVIEYDQNNKTMSVNYPPNVSPAEAEKYGSYTEVKDSERIKTEKDITVIIKGWQKLNKWQEKQYDRNWIPAKRSIVTYEPEEGKQWVMFSFAVENCKLGDAAFEQMINCRLHLGEDETEARVAGILTYPNPGVPQLDPGDPGSDAPQVAGNGVGYFSCAFLLNDEQMKNLDDIAITFSDLLCRTRYVYYPAQNSPLTDDIQ